MYVCIELVFTVTTYLQQRNMDQPRKVATPARGQLTRESKCPCRCILRGKYIYMYCCMLLFIYQVYFLFGDIMCIRARFTAVYANMCEYSGMYMYVYTEQYIYMVIPYICKVVNPARGQLVEQGK